MTNVRRGFIVWRLSRMTLLPLWALRTEKKERLYFFFFRLVRSIKSNWR